MEAALNETAQLIAAELLAALAERRGGPLVVGIDGPDCSGKSTLSRQLVAATKATASVVCLHFDDYANSREIREKRGEFSVDAFYFDYFDSQALLSGMEAILLDGPPLQLLLVEGLFLYRPPLLALFHYRIRLEISETMLLARALQRDVGRIGNIDWVRRHYEEQCIPAQRRYVREHVPAADYDFLLTAREDGSFDVRR